MKTNTWYSLKGQSLAIYARNAGFDLAVYEKYKDDIKDELRKRAVKEAIKEIRSSSEEQGCDIGEIKEGVYVISLSNPLAIQYQKDWSQVIYVGMGNIIPRIKRHFEYSLFDFMLSLSGASFDINFACPKLQNAPTYFKHVEHLILEHFKKEFGGLGHEKPYPILNKNAGADKNFKGGTIWWKKPLKSSGKKPLWRLSPTSFSDFAVLE